MQARRSTLALLILTAMLAGCGRVLTQPTAQPTSTRPLATVALAWETPRPTEAMIPRPTEPSPTPRPTATPVVHVIEPGDTLLDIAARFQVSVDEIMLANPELRPQLLQIGQRINIPAGDQSSSAVGLLPAPTPLPLRIAGVRLYRTPVGGLWALGEVFNDTGSPVEEVQVSVDLYDAKGAVSATMITWCARGITPPGESAPFGVLFARPPADVTIHQVTLMHAVPATHPSRRHNDLSVAQHQGGPAGSIYRVTGVISNTGDETAQEITVLVTLYDSASQVTGFRQVPLPSPLAQGSTAPFDVWLSPGAPGTDHYAVYVSGWEATSAE
jgi:LysM repeat protein